MTVLAGWRIPILLGAVAAAGTWVGVDQLARYEPPPPGDRVRQAVAELDRSNVYVAPDARALLDAEGAERVDRLAAAADPEVFVVVWTPSGNAGYDLESDAVGQIASGVGRDGVYLLVDDSQSLSLHEAGRRRSDGSAGYELYGRLDQALVEHIGELDALPLAAEGDPSNPGYWGPVLFYALLGVLAGLAAFALALVLLGGARVLCGLRFLLPTTSVRFRRLFGSIEQAERR